MRFLVVRHLTRVALFMLFGKDEAGSMTGDSHEPWEVSGPSHRIGLSGANKTMLHLLKKAKVQLIKIDQQKQLKLSQVRIQDQICASGKEDFLVLKTCLYIVGSSKATIISSAEMISR